MFDFSITRGSMNPATTMGSGPAAAVAQHETTLGWEERLDLLHNSCPPRKRGEA